MNPLPNHCPRECGVFDFIPKPTQTSAHISAFLSDIAPAFSLCSTTGVLVVLHVSLRPSWRLRFLTGARSSIEQCQLQMRVRGTLSHSSRGSSDWSVHLIPATQLLSTSPFHVWPTKLQHFLGPSQASTPIHTDLTFEGSFVLFVADVH